jgi:anti-sigma factor RsiW
MSDPSTHLAEWNDRLQDWLDGDLNAADEAELQAHMADCALCRARADELRELDFNLANAAPRIALDDAFDARLFARIDEMVDAAHDSQRAAARQRMEQELQQNLQALARGWRRSLLVVVAGAIAGVAMAFGLTTWLNDAEVMHTLVVESARLGSENSGSVHLVVTTLLGATLGGAIARWLASVAE